MALAKLVADLNIHQGKPDKVRGQATATKEYFDKAPNDIKDFINGTLTVEVDTLNTQNVKLTGAQSIADVKTFTSSPIVPTPTTDMQTSTKKYVDDMGTSKTNDLTTHKSSADHDGRYYTETEINGLLATKTSLTGNHQGTWQGYSPTQTDPGIQAVVDEHTAQLAEIAKFETAGGTGTAITLADVSLTDGASKTFIASADNNALATRINTKPLYKPGTTTAPKLITGKAYTVWYNAMGDCFFIKASASGTALAEHVLAGYTFSNDLDTDIDGTAVAKILITNEGTAQGICAESITKGNLVTTRSFAGADIRNKLSNPSTLPSADGNAVALSLDGVYLAVGNATTAPYLHIYKRSGDVFTELADPSTVPGNNVNGLAFSADGTYLAVACSASPFIIIYKRSGDTFTKLTNPATLPPTASNVAFSTDVTYLVVTTYTAPYLHIYKRSGDVFTKLTDPATLPTGMAMGCKFSYDGTYLALTHDVSPYVTIYKRSSDTFTKLTNPTTLPTGLGYHPAFSNDGVYLAIAHATSPHLTIYKRSGDVFTKLANPIILPTGMGTGCTFSYDGLYLIVTHATSPHLTIYKRSGDVFTKLANPAVLPTNQGNAVAISQGSVYLAIAHVGTPYVTIYKADVLTGYYLYKYTAFTDLSDSRYVNFGYATEDGVINDTVDIVTIPIK